MANKNIFRFINLIRNGISQTDEELRDFNLYLIQKTFYYAPGNERLANITNVLWNIPKPLQYKLLCILFKGKQAQWIKKVKNEKDVSEIMHEYGCSRKTALQYEEILKWKK